jgi:hypothetical protein
MQEFHGAAPVHYERLAALLRCFVHLHARPYDRAFQ